MGRLWMVGEAIGRNVTARHWPGHGPTDEHLTEIAANMRAASDRAGRESLGASDPVRHASIEHARSQVMHTLCVAAHGTAVVLRAYVTDLQLRQPPTEADD